MSKGITFVDDCQGCGEDHFVMVIVNMSKGELVYDCDKSATRFVIPLDVTEEE